MDKKMVMINTLESHYKALMDRQALDINNLLDESDSGSLDMLIHNIFNYSNTLNQLNFVQKLKENLVKSEDHNES